MREHLGHWWWVSGVLMILFLVTVVWSLVYLSRYWPDGAPRSKLDEASPTGKSMPPSSGARVS